MNRLARSVQPADEETRGILLGFVSVGEFRIARLIDEDPDPACASCGATDELRRCPRTGVPFCLDCLERARPPEWYDELGVAG